MFYLPHVIKDYFKNGEAWNVTISYVQEESPLGTAGALSLIPGKQMYPLIVTNGDLLTNVGYKEILDHHFKIGSKATMVVRHHETQNPFGVVNTEGFRITGFEEKPVYRSLINAGVYVLDPLALEALPYGVPVTCQLYLVDCLRLVIRRLSFLCTKVGWMLGDQMI